MGIPAYFKFDFFQPIIVSAPVFASVSILCYCFRDTPAVCFRGVQIISSNSLVTCLRFSPLTSGENFIPLPNHFPSALIKRLYVIHAASQCVLRVTGTLNRQAVECHSSAAQLCCDYLIVFFPRWSDSGRNCVTAERVTSGSTRVGSQRRGGRRGAKA